MRNSTRLFFLPLLLLFLWVMPAQAHKVNVFAYAEGGTVYTESYFPDGRPVSGGTILVYTEGGEKIIEGKTDAGGLFSFPCKEKKTLKIVIDASMGHKNSFILKREEM